MKAWAYILSLCLSLTAISPLLADDEDQAKTLGRLQLAINFKSSAIKQLQKIAAKSADDEQIGVMARVVETRNEIARLTLEQDEVSGSSSVVSTRYRNSLEAVIKESSNVLSLENSGRVAIRMRFLRGEAYRALGKKQKALEDLKWAALQPERTADSTAAALVAYDLLVAQGDYRSAISCMKNVDAKEGDAHFPLVLEYLAWSYYYQADYTRAINTLSRLFNYQQGRAEKISAVEREQTYKGAGIFLASAIEEKKPGFTVSSGLSFLRKNVEQEHLAAAMKYFAMGLSSKNLYPELHSLLEIVQKWEGFSSGALLPIRLLALDQVLDLRNGDETEKATASLIADPSFESGSYESLSDDVRKSLKKQLSRAANQLLMRKGKPGDVLIRLLGILKDFPDATAEERAIHRHNLAEVAFRGGRYDEATQEYLWIAENARGEIASEARLKAIGSRFESIKASGAIPKEIAVEKAKDQPSRELEAPVREWIKWIGIYEKSGSSKREKAEPFRFEASRILFHAGRFKEAQEGFQKLAKESKDVELATLSAGAVLDSLIAAEKWEDLLPQAIEYSRKKGWEKKSISRKAAGIAADATLQLATQSYRAQQYTGALERVEALSKTGIATEKWGDLYVLAAHAALALEDKARAETYLAKVLKSDLKPKLKAKALLGAAALAETQFEFDGAAENYLNAFSLQVPVGDEGETLLARSLHLAWLSGNARLLQKALSHPAVCGKSSKVNCGHYESLEAAAFPTTSAIKKAFERSDGKGKDRTIWALVALQAGKISAPDRLALLGLVASGWASQDSITQFALLPLVPGILRGFSSARLDLGLDRQIEVSKAALGKKAKAIKRFEDELGQFFEFPLTRIRVQALHEVATAYRDLALRIQSVSLPNGLAAEEKGKIREMLTQTSAPFVEKQRQLEEKAFIVASRSSVNPDLFKPVGVAYFKSFPEQARILWANWSAPTLTPVHQVLSKVLSKTKEPRVRAWQKALEAEHWAAVGSLMEEVPQGEMTTRVLQRMKAASLSAVGENAEAVAELEVLRRNGGEKDPDVCLCLLNQYVTTFAKAEAALALEGCAEVAAAAPALRVAVPWAGEELSSSIRNRYPAGAGGGE